MGYNTLGIKSIMRTILALIAILSASCFATEHGEKGFTMDVSVSGFFSPVVNEAIIKSVIENSSAEKAGLIAGDHVIAIDGCAIPGCSASIAKKALRKQVGEIVVLTMEKPDGTTYEAHVILQ